MCGSPAPRSTSASRGTSDRLRRSAPAQKPGRRTNSSGCCRGWSRCTTGSGTRAKVVQTLKQILARPADERRGVVEAPRARATQRPGGGSSPRRAGEARRRDRPVGAAVRCASGLSTRCGGNGRARGDDGVRRGSEPRRCVPRPRPAQAPLRRRTRRGGTHRTRVPTRTNEIRIGRSAAGAPRALRSERPRPTTAHAARHRSALGGRAVPPHGRARTSDPPRTRRGRGTKHVPAARGAATREAWHGSRTVPSC